MKDLVLNVNPDNIELLKIIKWELNYTTSPKNIFKVLTKYYDSDELMLVLGIGRNTFYNYKRYVKSEKSKDDDLKFNYIEKKLIKFRILLMTNDLINNLEIRAW